jgi:hypothetical protein
MGRSDALFLCAWFDPGAHIGQHIEDTRPDVALLCMVLFARDLAMEMLL